MWVWPLTSPVPPNQPCNWERIEVYALFQWERGGKTKKTKKHQTKKKKYSTKEHLPVDKKMTIFYDILYSLELVSFA